MDIETFFANCDWPIDIENAPEVELLIRDDGKTLWLNTRYGCLVRLCQIKGEITINDKRKARRNKVRMATSKRKNSNRSRG